MELHIPAQYNTIQEALASITDAEHDRIELVLSADNPHVVTGTIKPPPSCSLLVIRPAGDIQATIQCNQGCKATINIIDSSTCVEICNITIVGPPGIDTKVIRVGRGGRVVLRECAITHAKRAKGSDQGPYPKVFAAAILVHGRGSTVDVIDCSVTSTGHYCYGVVALAGSQVAIERTMIGPCNQCGLFARDRNTTVSAIDTTIDRTSGYGSWYTLKGARTSITASRILNSGHYGVMCLHDESFSEVRDCTITGSHWQAISVRWGGAGTFVGNNLHGNRLGPWGIRLSCAGSVERSGNVPQVDEFWCEKWTAPDGSTPAVAKGDQPGESSDLGQRVPARSSSDKHASSLAPEPLRTAVGTTGYPQRGVSRQLAVSMLEKLRT